MMKSTRRNKTICVDLDGDDNFISSQTTGELAAILVPVAIVGLIVLGVSRFPFAIFQSHELHSDHLPSTFVQYGAEK